ncbi:glucosaminidase domain-containing protein [Sutcliffiella sp. NPDC057660]|uniref:glucosaminidase domain-containing protein n=1 Tax=Sutcliffiella sp. NPDC057660 TaxID=3346199 RepID=UPI0036AC623D
MKVIFSCLVAVVFSLSSLSSFFVYAENKEELEIGTTVSFVEIMEDVAIYSDKEVQIAIIEKGATISGFFDENVFLLGWGKGIAQIKDLTSLSIMEDGVKQSESLIEFNEDTVYKELVTQESTIIYDYDTHEKMVVSEKEIILHYIEGSIILDEETIEVGLIEIGEKLGYFFLPDSPIESELNEESSEGQEKDKEGATENIADDVNDKVTTDTGVTEESADKVTEEIVQNNTTSAARMSITSFAAPVQEPTPSFTAEDKYFRVSESRVSVYDNSTGSLVHVGYLNLGEVFPRVSDYGDWHRVKYGNGYGFIWKPATKPATKEEIARIKNLNTSFQNSSKSITAIDTISVYDNSSGSLVPFAALFKGVKYPVIGEYGADWYRVDVSGRIGYVYKPATKTSFTSQDQYFEVLENNVSIYDNSTGKLVHVGYLTKGQVYPRIKDYGADWHQVKYGNSFGYVWKDATRPSNASTIKNLNINQVNSNRSFKAQSVLSVYDNSSGALVPFASLQKGISYPIISDIGGWLKIDILGRIGYVYKPATRIDFQATDRYFEVLEDNVSVMDNSGGVLQPAGYLTKGQVYPILRNYGDWHEIKFGRTTAYVWKAATNPSSSSMIKNENVSNILPSDRNFLALQNTMVYDNSSGALVPFATIKQGTSYPIISDYGSDWYKVDFAGRIGYIYKPATQEGPIYRYSNYDITFQQFIDRQMAVAPQTDKRYQDFYYTREDGYTIDPINPNVAILKENGFRIRTQPSVTNSRIIATLNINLPVDNRQTIVERVLGDDGYIWYKVRRTWVNATREDVVPSANPESFSRNSADYFQFLVLSEPAGLNAKEINEKILVNKGSLTGLGALFVEAANKYKINEIYLLSHALLETGHGTSSLSKGIQYNGQTVYNMYGFGAFDGCAEGCGAERAYKEKWFTPEAAILGGAKIISEYYINHPTYKQDTLYKMRWNPATPATHQYATDKDWAIKQVNSIKRYYDLVDTYTLIFDVPVFK